MPPEPATKRAVAFVDGQNLFFAARQAFGYRMLERRLPVFATPDARRGRYYLRDNFLRRWLG